MRKTSNLQILVATRIGEFRGQYTSNPIAGDAFRIKCFSTLASVGFAFLAIWRSQADADSMLIDLEP